MLRNSSSWHFPGLGRPVEDWLRDVAEGRGPARPEVMRATLIDSDLYLQVLLGQAVAGLSVVAITDYGVGILGYLVKGLPGLPGLPVDATSLMALAIAPVAGLVWWKVRRARRKLE